MKPVNKKQIVVVAGSLILIVLLLFVNTRLPKNKEDVQLSDHAGPNTAAINTVVESAKSTLNANQKAVIAKLEGAIKTSADKKTAFENMIGQWDSLRQPAVAAYYMEQAA